MSRNKRIWAPNTNPKATTRGARRWPSGSRARRLLPPQRMPRERIAPIHPLDLQNCHMYVKLSCAKRRRRFRRGSREAWRNGRNMGVFEPFDFQPRRGAPWRPRARPSPHLERLENRQPRHELLSGDIPLHSAVLQVAQRCEQVSAADGALKVPVQFALGLRARPRARAFSLGNHRSQMTSGTPQCHRGRAGRQPADQSRTRRNFPKGVRMAAREAAPL